METLNLFAKSALTISSFLIFFNIWNGSFVNSDDIIYVEMAREISSGGGILDLSYQGAMEHQRPPLAIWLMALSGSLLGFEEFGMRLPAVLAAVFSLLFAAMISWELFREGKRSAYAVMLLVASAIFFFNSRRVMTDTIFLLGMLSFIWSYLKALRNHKFLILSGISLGWMTMTKGAVSAVAIAPVIIDLFLRRRKDLISNRYFLIGAVLALILILPWHAAQTARFGLDFWRDYVGFNIIKRAAASLFSEADRMFYINRFIEDEGILSLLFLAGLCFTHWKFLKEKGEGERFVLIWAFCAFLPFQISQTKIPHYMLPLYPALALMASHFLASLPNKFIFSAAATALCAGIFVSHNLKDLLSPDYSPDQKEFAEFVKANSSEKDMVTVFNYYDLALAHYSGRKLSLSTDDKKMHQILVKSPILERSKCVRLASIDEIIASAPYGVKLFILAENKSARQVREAMEKSGSFASVQTLKGRRLSLIAGL